MNRLAKELTGAARSPEDPDAVHDLRVAIRRFVESIKIFPEVCGHSQSRKFRRKLKPLIRALGEVRNLDVTTGVLAAARIRPTPVITRQIQSEKRKAEKALTKILRSWRKRETLEEWRKDLKGKAGGARAFSAARDEAPDMLVKLVKNGECALEPGVPYRRMHRFRIASKRLRYTLELFWPDNKNELKLLKQLQDHLGSVNDCVTVLDLIDDAPNITERVRALRTLRENALREFWKENHGTLSAASRRS
jgi:CHAD domain-containing protein